MTEGSKSCSISDLLLVMEKSTSDKLEKLPIELGQRIEELSQSPFAKA